MFGEWIGRGLLTAAMAVFASAAAAPARAQGLSDRPTTIVVPFTPGTGIDILARTIGEEIRQRWNRTVVVDNKPGASGVIGTHAAARSKPDGHTLLMTVNTFVMNASLLKSIPYDPVKSFVPVAEVAVGALALVVHPSVPAESARAFIEHARTRPGEVTYASPGVGTPQHLAMELFKLTARIDVRHIPYKGSAGAVTDLTGGHVHAMFLPVHTALPFAEKQAIRILAVGSNERSPLAPDVPTLAEQGVTGFEVDLWYGLLAPAGTPKDIVDRYNAVVNEILVDPRVVETLSKQGLTPVGGTPERLAELVAKDRDRWAKVVEEAGITPE